jgi:hypothetical protein
VSVHVRVPRPVWPCWAYSIVSLVRAEALEALPDAAEELVVLEPQAARPSPSRIATERAAERPRRTLRLPHPPWALTGS